MELKSVREPFCLEWKISNFSHWSVEVHGDKLETIVDFDHGQRVEFRLCKGYVNVMMLFYPPELWPYKGQLVIRGSDGRVFCSLEKRKGIAILPIEQCEGKLGDNCVLFITLENACENLRCEYATTVLKPLSPGQKLGVLLGNHVMRRQRHLRQRRDPLNSNRDPQFVRQLIPSLESLAIGQVSNQPSKNDLPLTVQGSLEDRISRFFSQIARPTRRVHTFLQIPTIKQPSTDLSFAPLAIGQGSNDPLRNDLLSPIHWSMENRVSRLNSVLARRVRRFYPSLQMPTTIYQPSTDLSTARPTPEQLIPSLGSLSISQEVKASSSDQLHARPSDRRRSFEINNTF